MDVLLDESPEAKQLIQFDKNTLGGKICKEMTLHKCGKQSHPKLGAQLQATLKQE